MPFVWPKWQFAKSSHTRVGNRETYTKLKWKVAACGTKVATKFANLKFSDALQIRCGRSANPLLRFSSSFGSFIVFFFGDASLIRLPCLRTQRLLMVAMFPFVFHAQSGPLCSEPSCQASLTAFLSNKLVSNSRCSKSKFWRTWLQTFQEEISQGKVLSGKKFMKEDRNSSHSSHMHISSNVVNPIIKHTPRSLFWHTLTVWRV